MTSNGSIIQYCANSSNIRGLQADYLFADEIATFEDHEIFWRDVASRVKNKQGTLAAVSTPINTSDLLAQLMNRKGYFSKRYAALVDKNGDAYIDVFSCKEFDIETVKKVLDKYFKPQKIKVVFLTRQA